MQVDGTALNSSDYTIIVLEKRQSAGDNYFLGNSAASTAGESVLLGYKSTTSGETTTTTVIHSHDGSDGGYSAAASKYLSNSEYPNILTFIQNSSTVKKTYINGYLAAEDSNTDQLTNISDALELGKGYNGEIGEFLVFDRALKDEERKSIEQYLQKKWRIKGFSETAESCTSGEFTESGCDQSCSISVIGSDEETSSLTNGTSETVTCNEANFDGGNETYTCSGSSINLTCGCASGYILDAGACVLASNCTGLSIVGSDVTSLDHGSTLISCNASGYIGNSTGNSCDNGSFVAGEACGSECDTGYSSVDGACVADPSSGIICSGGEESQDGAYKVHVFNTSGILDCRDGLAGNVEVLVVGGGGGGSGGKSSAGGSGAGAGGLIYNASFAISTSLITVTVGDGGSGGAVNGSNGSNGDPSVFSSIIAAGGGGGGVREKVGSSGGSGGGGGISAHNKDGGSATPSGQGFAGGTNGNASPKYGGGAGGEGQAGTSTKGGDGGIGLEYSISGSPIYYASGGASSFYGSDGTYGSALLGGGGEVGSAGTANTGGGGGGATNSSSAGNAGGSGIVIVRYPTPED